LLDRRTATRSRTLAYQDFTEGTRAAFSAADAEQLESRRAELEQERFQLSEQLRSHMRQLRNLRAARETVDRQRAALLSARSIEHVQRELTAVQKKLEYCANADQGPNATVFLDENPLRASDFLAQLTDGQLVRLHLVDGGRRVNVVCCDGQTKPLSSLSASQRDQVYLSLCLALLLTAGRHGIHLPLVLDEPFERLDARSTAALAAVLADFCRQGHQVLVLTAQRAAARQLQSVGAKLHDLASAKRQNDETCSTVSDAEHQPLAESAVEITPARKRRRRKSDTLRSQSAPHGADNNSRTEAGQSDAA